MKMDFPQVDLPTEVLAWTNVTEDILNIYKQSLGAPRARERGFRRGGWCKEGLAWTNVKPVMGSV